ncbi:MAG: hypothetical protein M3076_18455 [Actinomycetota bacterium]|nr:hypothetical protein [Actinomycetota bacterium]
MAVSRTLTPGYVVVYPNREKPASVTVKAVVVALLLLSVLLMLIVTIGGWSKLEGMKAVNFVWCLAYLLLAFYIATRWARGLLPIAAALAILLLLMSLVAGIGVTGTSWFDRNSFGFGAPHTLFGGQGLGPDLLGLITLLLAPIQALLIFFAMMGFAQGWNIEVEVPADEAKRRVQTPRGPRPRPAQA